MGSVALSTKSKFRLKQFITFLLASLACIWLNFVVANPQGGQVIAGSAAISQGTNTTTITQSTDKAVINWRTFNIAPHETTRFIQPSTNSIVLNRVNPNFGASQIHGILTANGNVWIINPAGIVFGKGAQVNVGGLLATTADISNANFMKGNYQFKQDAKWSSSSVINHGTITVRQGGMAALVAPGVENNGIIQANMGKVALASGNTYTVDLYGDNMIHFGMGSEITQPGKDANGRPMKHAVSNSGKIIANGGKVLLTVSAAKNIVESSINMSGVIHAKSVYRDHKGSIVLAGGNHGIVKVTGILNASGRHSGQKGGTVKISGEKVLISENAKIDVTGNRGGGKIYIGGGRYGKDKTINNAKNTYVGPNVKLYADAIHSGNGGDIVVWADDTTQFYGSASARGGSISGDGGFVETSGKNYLDIGNNALVDTRAPKGKIGEWLLDPLNITVAIGGTATLAEVDAFAINPSTNRTIDPSTINNATSHVILQANTDITISNTINMINNGVGFTAQAGRDININANVTTNNGPINLTANDASAIVANRTDNSTGDITMAAGTAINAGSGNVNLTIGSTNTLPANPGFNPGSIIAQNISTTGSGTITLTTPNTVTLNDALTSEFGGIAINANTAIITDTKISGLVLGTSTVGNLTVITNGPITQTGTLTVLGTATFMAGADNNIILDHANNLSSVNIISAQDFTLANGTNPVSFDNSNVFGNLSVTAGAISQTCSISVTGTSNFNAGANPIILDDIKNFFSGPVSLTNSGANHNILLVNFGDLQLGTSSVSSNLTINTSGSVTQSGTLNVPGTLTINSTDGTILNAANTISAFNATNSNNGDIQLTNTIPTLSMTGITQSGDGDVIINNTGALNVMNSITTENGNIHLTGTTGIKLGANLNSSGNQTFNNAVTLENNSNLTASEIIFNSILNGPYKLTLNTGATGDITFNGNVGNLQRLAHLEITNAHNVTNHAHMNVSTFTQLAGTGLTALGANSLNALGSSEFTTHNVTGNIDTGTLSLNTHLANLTGRVAGFTGISGAKLIVIKNLPFQTSTHFFDGIDLANIPPTPPVPPTPPITPTSTPEIGNVIGITYPYQILDEDDTRYYAVEKAICTGKECLKLEIKLPKYPASIIKVSAQKAINIVTKR